LAENCATVLQAAKQRPGDGAIELHIYWPSGASYSRINGFQDNIAHGKEDNWRCRAGARYLYICEDGLVHYCSQQRGYPGKPLLEYTREGIRREYRTAKGWPPLHRRLRPPDRRNR
jgi:MoaA/NifB/PqqE/SkfB family radical SAM enzyme